MSKEHMVISIDTRKVFDKIRQSRMRSRNQETRVNIILNIINSIQGKEKKAIAGCLVIHSVLKGFKSSP